MIYIIMSTILVLVIIFILFGAITVNEETKNNNGKDDSNKGGDEPSDEAISRPLPEPYTLVIKPVRKTATKRRVQPSVKRTSGGAKKRVSKKVTVK